MTKTQTPTPTAPRTESAKPKFCRCNCGAEVGKKSLYRPGHDARHVSASHKELALAEMLDTAEAQARVDEIFASLGSDALRAKLGRMVDNDKNGMFNGFGDNGVHVPFSTNPSLGRSEWTYGEAKVGRWTYPSRSNGKVTEVNSKRDGSGNWTAL